MEGTAWLGHQSSSESVAKNAFRVYHAKERDLLLKGTFRSVMMHLKRYF